MVFGMENTLAVGKQRKGRETGVETLIIRGEEGHTGVGKDGKMKSRKRSTPRPSSDGTGRVFLLVSVPKLGVVTCRLTRISPPTPIRRPSFPPFTHRAVAEWTALAFELSRLSTSKSSSWW